MFGQKPIGVAAATVVAGLAIAPAVAHATIKEGKGAPELYENGMVVGPRENASHMFTGDLQEEFGQFAIEAENLPEGIECVYLGFSSGWNEGSPRRAFGQIESWGGDGHVPNEEHPKVSSNCRPEASRAFVTDEDFSASEQTEGKFVLAKRSLSTPWNIEFTCGVREGAFDPIVEIGVPSSEFPKANTPCPANSTEAEEEREIAGYAAEKAEHEGCYKSNPAPAGCIRFTIVEPGAGGEFAYGGTLHMTSIDGIRNGLTPSRWSLEGSRSGTTQCEFPEGCTGEITMFGELKDIGYTGVQLIQVK